MNAVVLQIYGQTQGYPRPPYTDLLVWVIDVLTFAILAYKLITRRLRSKSDAYRAIWGIIAVGSAWQSVVVLARLTHYHLPDWIWSGWALQDIGLFALVCHSARLPVNKKDDEA